MPGSTTTPGHTDARTIASVRIAFRPFNSVGTRNHVSFAAQWLACALPYRRFARTLADTGARLGADADRYSFIAVDSHHLLLAGFTGAPNVTLFSDVPPCCAARGKGAISRPQSRNTCAYPCRSVEAASAHADLMIDTMKHWTNDEFGIPERLRGFPQ